MLNELSKFINQFNRKEFPLAKEAVMNLLEDLWQENRAVKYKDYLRRGK